MSAGRRLKSRQGIITPGPAARDHPGGTRTADTLAGGSAVPLVTVPSIERSVQPREDLGQQGAGDVAEAQAVVARAHDRAADPPVAVAIVHVLRRPRVGPAHDRIAPTPEHVAQDIRALIGVVALLVLARRHSSRLLRQAGRHAVACAVVARVVVAAALVHAAIVPPPLVVDPAVVAMAIVATRRGL